MSDPPLSQKKQSRRSVPVWRSQWNCIGFYLSSLTLGTNMSSPIQVGQAPYLTKSDCLDAAAQSVFTKAGNVQAITWCGPVRLEGALSSGPPAVIRSAPAAPK
jgi:hypothetical protein